MPKNAFAVAVTDVAAVLIEPVPSSLSDIYIKNTSANTIYIDINNPLVDSTDGMPIAKDEVVFFSISPISVIWAVTAAGLTATVNVMRWVSPFSYV